MKTNVSSREKFIWNMLGSLSNAFSSLILSICVNRFIGGESGGIFAFAYSNAQLMITIGQFEVRPYQSTDIEEKYKFNTYYVMRVLTCLLMIIISGIYAIIGDFSVEKKLVVFVLAAFKMVEAYSDVYGGRFQQKDRIDLSGKLFFTRVVSSTIVFILLILLTRNLIISSLGLFITSFTLFFVYDKRHIFEEDRGKKRFDHKAISGLFIEVLPLFVGAFVMMYISNAPKYAINEQCTDEIQNVYNILFMPAFVINLFSAFVFRPMLIEFTQKWNSGKIGSLAKDIAKMYGIIVGFTLCAMIGCWFFGIPILNFVYNIELAEYRQHLVMVMIVGGISACVSFINNIVTVMRKQRLALVGCIVACVYIAVAAPILVERYSLTGAIISYGTAIGLLAIVFNFIAVLSAVRRKKGE